MSLAARHEHRRPVTAASRHAPRSSASIGISAGVAPRLHLAERCHGDPVTGGPGVKSPRAAPSPPRTSALARHRSSPPPFPNLPRRACIPAASLLATAALLFASAATAAPTQLPPNPASQLDAPADVAVSPRNGEILVADRGNDRIARFSRRGRYLGQLPAARIRGGARLLRPAAVAIDSHGDIWVGDSGNHRLQKFGPRGHLLTECGSRGDGPGQFSVWGPKDIAVDADDDIWVTDYSGRVQEFSPTCRYLRHFGSEGKAAGEFIQSAGIDIGPEGNLFVSDWVSQRVSVFTPSGAFLFQFGAEGSEPGHFHHPDGLAIDPEGNVWVIDEGNGRVERFDLRGHYRGQFGAPGHRRRQFAFRWPDGLTSDGSGHLWVTDSGNDRVQRWSR